MPAPTQAPSAAPPIDSLLFAATRIGTFEHQRALTNATGFFFAVSYTHLTLPTILRV